MSELTYIPIGVVHSPFKEPKNVPIQATASKGITGNIEVYPQYVEGFKRFRRFFTYYFALSLSPSSGVFFDG